MAEDNCKLVAQNVRLKLKINIVLLDCMKWEDVSGSFSKMSKQTNKNVPTYLRFLAYLLPDTQGLQISGCNHNTEY